MSFIGMATTIISHIVAALYIQKQKLNKIIVGCAWLAYAILSSVIMLFINDMQIGFYLLFALHFVVFQFTSEGSFAENTFLFLAYSCSFCIYIGIDCILAAFIPWAILQKIATTAVLVMIHVFLYKILIPTYKKSKMFFASNWWSLNIVLILFFIQFLNQYAFSINDKSTATDLLVDFIIFSCIFYLVLVLIFNSVKNVAEKNKKAVEYEELKTIAYTDVLTNMKNRTAYTRAIKKKISLFKKNSDAFLTLVLLDVDGFKCINDTRGHISGDRILRNVGEAIVKHFQSPCCDCFRIGGDEFVLLMENAEKEQIEELVNRLNVYLLESDDVTVSYGFSIVDFNKSKPFESAFENADSVMYSNKRNRNSTNSEKRDSTD